MPSPGCYLEKFVKKSLILGAALLGCLAASAQSAFAGPQLVTDGTFANGTAVDWTGFQTANGTPDSVEVNPSAVYGLPAYNGNPYNLEVNANYVDTVTQTITGLVVGDYYELSFGYGNRGAGGAQILDVSFGGTLVTVDTYNGTDAPFWATNSFLVLATATTEVLSFASQPVQGSLPSYGNEISDVSLIPEPASFAVLILGLTGLGVARRKRV